MRSVHAGGEQFVAILEDGSAWHWGFNTTSSLASGTWNAVPARIAGIEDAVWARASLARLFIRVADGRVFGLTGNAGGPMWDDPDAPVVLPIGVATEVAELHGVVDIGLGMQHGLALREDGTVLSWGSNGDGQLGDPGARRSRPAPVPGLDDVVAIAAGDWSGMALRADGTVWRWGYGNLVAAYVEGRDRSELPHDTASPVMVPGIDRIVAVGGIDAAEYALRDDGALFGWGGNTLGHWEGAPVIPPAQVPIPPVRVFFIGQAGSIHALTRDGRRLAWGNNYSFTVGNGGNGVYRAQWSPTPIYSP